MEQDERSKQKAMEKIKKCLALSSSANPHEAEAALRQAHKLMEMYQLQHADIDASRAEEFVVELGAATRQPALWIGMLSSVVAEAMSCVAFTRSGSNGQAIIFIGERGSGELAAYAFQVLSRQLQFNKKEYQKGLPDNGKGYKRRMGTLYAEGWIQAVGDRVSLFSEMSERTAGAINAYTSRHYPEIKPARQKVRYVSLAERGAHSAGLEDGKRAALHRPLNQSEVLRLE